MVDWVAVVLAKKEVTYGTDAVPVVATNGVLTRNYQGKPIDVDRIERNLDSSVYGAQRIVAAGPNTAFAAGTIAAAQAARPAAVGWVADSDSTTVASMIEELLGNSSLLWLLNASGEIVIREWTWGASVTSATSQSVKRTSVLAPVGTRTLGYKRNETQMARGDLAAIVLWGDIAGDGKPESGATRNAFQGSYNAAATYMPGDAVLWERADGGTGAGYTRIGAGNTTGTPPSDAAKWAIFVETGEPGVGDPGPPGPAATSAYLTNEAVQLPAYANGNVVAYLTAFPLFQSRCPALVGQTFNASVIVRRIGGSAPPVGAGMFVEVAEETAPSTFIANQASYYPQNEATEVLLSVSRTVATGNQARTGVSMRVDTGLTVDVTYRIKALQFEIGSTRTAFQFNYSSTSVTEPGQPDCHFLAFDGVDDFLVTGTITPGTDKVQAVVGQRKLSDASVAVVIETGPTSSVNNFTLHAPRTAGVGNYGFVFRSDTGGANDVNSASHVAPETAVVTGVSDLSGDLSLIRVNGLEENRKTYDHGVGSFAGHPLYIGRRAGSANAFNGRIYSLVTRFGPNLTAAQIAQTEAWVNSKTRAY